MKDEKGSVLWILQISIKLSKLVSSIFFYLLKLNQLDDITLGILKYPRLGVFFKLISGGKKERIICCSMKSPWWGTRRQDLRSAL